MDIEIKKIKEISKPEIDDDTFEALIIWIIIILLFGGYFGYRLYKNPSLENVVNNWSSMTDAQRFCIYDNYSKKNKVRLIISLPYKYSHNMLFNHLSFCPDFDFEDVLENMTDVQIDFLIDRCKQSGFSDKYDLEKIRNKSLY